jgi:hypothetical protein
VSRTKFVTSFRNLLVLSFFANMTSPVVANPSTPMNWELPPIKDRAVQTRADRLYKLSEGLARHLIAGLRPWKEDASLLLLTDSRSTEHFIRPNTGTVAGLAMLYRFGPYDENAVGLPRADLLNTKILPMMRYLTTTHVTGSLSTSDGKKWGNAWQSAQWAEALGLAAWFVGRDLPPDLVAEVRRVVAYEAGRFVDATPPHQLKADTKAEENAWNSKVLSMAVVLMPGDDRRPAWERAFQKWALSGWLRPADEHSSVLVDGLTLSQQFTGANIYDDFTLENHNIVHPDYMTAWSQSLGCSIEHLMTGRRPPEALRHNVSGIHENLKWFRLPDGGLMYPSGQDWALFRQIDWLYPNLVAAVIFRDPEAWIWTDQLVQVAKKMQARSADGSLYLSEENFFASASTDKLYQFTRGWLALHFAEGVAAKEPARRGVKRLEGAKIILNRTAKAVHAVCWGTKIMGQCAPLQQDRMISPDTRSGVGHIRLKGDTKPLQVSLGDARVTNDSRSFTAELMVNHGDAVRSELTFRSKADGSWSITEKLMALREIETDEIATGLVGILNDRDWIFERGERELRIGKDKYRMRSCAGTVLAAVDVHYLSVDSVLRIKARTPLQVRYKAATEYQRSRVTDELSLNCIAGNRSWKAGQTISQWEATVHCEPRRK